MLCRQCSPHTASPLPVHTHSHSSVHHAHRTQAPRPAPANSLHVHAHTSAHTPLLGSPALTHIHRQPRAHIPSRHLFTPSGTPLAPRRAHAHPDHSRFGRSPTQSSHPLVPPFVGRHSRTLLSTLLHSPAHMPRVLHMLPRAHAPLFGTVMHICTHSQSAPSLQCARSSTLLHCTLSHTTLKS